MSAKRTLLRRWEVWGLLVLVIATALALVTGQFTSKKPQRAQSVPPLPQDRMPETTTSMAQSTIRFTDVTAAAGIDFVHFAGATGQKWYPETIGSGVGFFDYDNDGRPDILLINGTSLPTDPSRKTGVAEPTLRLYRNRGDGTFTDVTHQAGLAVPVYGMGLAVGDYDNDGDRDLVVTGYRRNLFFINNGDGSFNEAADRLGLQSGLWGTGAAFLDYDRDGFLDLVISHYIDWTPELERGLDCKYGMPTKDYCPVRYFKGQGLRLYHNRGDGTFVDTTQRAGVSSEGTRALASYVFDIDDDQWPDIFVASDGTPSLLYRNRGDGTFQEVGVRSGVVLDEKGTAYAGMGIDATYPMNDAQLCIAIGNFVGEPTTLHCRVRQGKSFHPHLYAEVSGRAGIGRPTLRYVTFGLFFADMDLDGFEDLFMVNGHVVDEARLRNSPRAQPPQLFRNLGNGQFEEVHASAENGLDWALVGRGTAYADYDGDGDIDILIGQNQGPALLLRNDTTPQKRYLRVRLQGTTSNRDGIGALVRVQTGQKIFKQMLRSGRSYLSQHELTLTFGVDAVNKVDRVEVTWPSGIVDVYRDVAVNTLLHVVEGEHVQALLHAPEPDSRAATEGDAVLDHPRASTSQAFLKATQTGIGAYRAKRYAEAADAFEAAIRLRPFESLPYRYLADLYWRQGATAQAEQTVSALARVLPDAYFLDRLGSSFEEANLPGLGILLYQTAIGVDAQFPSAHYNLGRALLERGDLEAGIAEVKRALQLYPEFADAHLSLGLAYSEQGRMELAITHIEEALRLQPDLTMARNHLGRIFMVQGRYQDAIRTFRTLIAENPGSVEGRHNLAVAYARQGLQEKALEQFRQAIALRPDFHAARMDMATLLLEMRRFDEAIQEFRNLFRQAGTSSEKRDALFDHTEAHYRLSVAYLMSGQVKEAIEELQLVIRQAPEHADAHTYLGRIYYENGQFDRAWKHARQAESLGVDVAPLIAALQRVSVEPE